MGKVTCCSPLTGCMWHLSAKSNTSFPFFSSKPRQHGDIFLKHLCWYSLFSLVYVHLYSRGCLFKSTTRQLVHHFKVLDKLQYIYSLSESERTLFPGAKLHASASSPNVLHHNFTVIKISQLICRLALLHVIILNEQKLPFYCILYWALEWFLRVCKMLKMLNINKIWLNIKQQKHATTVDKVMIWIVEK